MYANNNNKDTVAKLIESLPEVDQFLAREIQKQIVGDDILLLTTLKDMFQVPLYNALKDMFQVQLYNEIQENLRFQESRRFQGVQESQRFQENRGFQENHNDNILTDALAKISGLEEELRIRDEEVFDLKKAVAEFDVLQEELRIRYEEIVDLKEDLAKRVRHLPLHPSPPPPPPQQSQQEFPQQSQQQFPQQSQQQFPQQSQQQFPPQQSPQQSPPQQSPQQSPPQQSPQQSPPQQLPPMISLHVSIKNGNFNLRKIEQVLCETEESKRIKKMTSTNAFKQACDKRRGGMYYEYDSSDDEEWL
jgi:hypothetical protein